MTSETNGEFLLARFFCFFLYFVAAAPPFTPVIDSIALREDEPGRCSKPAIVRRRHVRDSTRRRRGRHVLCGSGHRPHQRAGRERR